VSDSSVCLSVCLSSPFTLLICFYVLLRLSPYLVLPISLFWLFLFSFQSFSISLCHYLTISFSLFCYFSTLSCFVSLFIFCICIYLLCCSMSFLFLAQCVTLSNWTKFSSSPWPTQDVSINVFSLELITWMSKSIKKDVTQRCTMKKQNRCRDSRANDIQHDGTRHYWPHERHSA